MSISELHGEKIYFANKNALFGGRNKYCDAAIHFAVFCGLTHKGKPNTSRRFRGLRP